MIGLEAATLRLGGRDVFARLSFQVMPGEALAVLGPNGRGKTSLLRAVLGLVPLAAGRRVAPERVGYVSQAGGPALRLPGREIVAMGAAAQLGLFGQPGRAERAAAEAALTEVGAAHLADRLFDRMSGGERQMVLIARALATGAPALVLDEPTSALDLGNQGRMLALLSRLRAGGKRAILFTTHDPNHALAVADRVLLMVREGPVAQGPVAEMITPGWMGRLYGVPMGWHLSETGNTRAILPIPPIPTEQAA
ncbi:MAG: ABC transporter ATP-binding protein [Gemmobacter sp.]